MKNLIMFCVERKDRPHALEQTPSPSSWARRRRMQEKGPGDRSGRVLGQAPAAVLKLDCSDRDFLACCPHPVQVKLPFSATGTVWMSKEGKVRA